MQMFCEGNVVAIIDAVSDMILKDPTNQPCSLSPEAASLTSRHSHQLHQEMECLREPGDMQLLQFRRAVEPVLARLSNAQNQPVPWRSCVSDDYETDGTLLQTLWNVIEQYAPGVLTYPSNRVTSLGEPRPTRTACAMCCADMNGTNGTCDVCSTVLYEVSMNHMHRQQLHMLLSARVSESSHHRRTRDRYLAAIPVVSWVLFVHTRIIGRGFNGPSHCCEGGQWHCRGGVPAEGTVSNGIGLLPRTYNTSRALCGGGQCSQPY